jgi:proteic killer suppression protein
LHSLFIRYILAAEDTQSKRGNNYDSGDTEVEGEARLELAFETKELRDICENEAEAKREFGDAVAEVLKHRLADLDAAISPRDLIVGNPRLGPGIHAMTVDLSEGYRLVFTPNHPHNPTTAAGSTDWEKVSRVRILKIGRQHA